MERFFSDVKFDKNEKEAMNYIIRISEQLEDSDVTVIAYRCRCLCARKYILYAVERDSFTALEILLAMKAGVRRADDTTYEVKQDGFNNLYIWCHDTLMTFSGSLGPCML